MKIQGSVIFVFLLISHLICAQNEIKLSIKTTFDKIPLDLETNTYQLHDGDSIQFETVKFYISSVVLLSNEKEVWRAQNSYYLIDVEKLETEEIRLKTDKSFDFDQIRFTIGIDSTTNVSGALGGDLDPTNGMYWTWDNGYINFKIEGKSKPRNTKSNRFEFHIGGYKKAFNAARNVTLSITGKSEIKVVLDLKEVFKNLDTTKPNLILSPGKESVHFSDKLAMGFKIIN